MNELITINLLSEDQVKSEINASVEMLKKSLFTRMISFIDYLRIVTQANYFISALNTNALITITNRSSEYHLDGHIVTYSIKFFLDTVDELSFSCRSTNPISPASFVSFFEDKIIYSHFEWLKPTINSTLVNGFFTACTPLEALLKSTLDCLYDIKCLHLLTQYFPNIQKVYLISSSILLSLLLFLLSR